MGYDIKNNYYVFILSMLKSIPPEEAFEMFYTNKSYYSENYRGIETDAMIRYRKHGLSDEDIGYLTGREWRCVEHRIRRVVGVQSHKYLSSSLRVKDCMRSKIEWLDVEGGGVQALIRYFEGVEDVLSLRNRSVSKQR